MESSVGLSISPSSHWTHSSSENAWVFISKQISGQKCCVSFAFALWDMLLSQCCKHMAMASYSSDPQRHCNKYMGLLVLWNLQLHKLVISMLELLNILFCEIDGEQMSPRKSSKASLESEGIYFGYYGYTSLFPQPVSMQSNVPQRDVATEAKVTLPLSIF